MFWHKIKITIVKMWSQYKRVKTQRHSHTYQEIILKDRQINIKFRTIKN